jgi:hypothetical protein
LQRETNNIFNQLHIVCWLFKDAAWAAGIHSIGVLMIVPTLALAIYFAKAHWHNITERYHNSAVVCWICANATWMIGEFFNWDEAPYHLRKVAVGIFGIGIAMLAFYYIYYVLLSKRASTPNKLH